MDGTRISPIKEETWPGTQPVETTVETNFRRWSARGSVNADEDLRMRLLDWGTHGHGRLIGGVS